MGFSFRSIFQSSSASREPLDASLPSYPQFPSSAAAFEPAPSMHPAPPLNASHSPFSAANPLFRTVAGEAVAPAPPAQSPFATPATSNTSSPLTVGDVLPQLPPDVVRLGALSPDQPVAIAPAILDAALRSGQAALPIFEIYRVCPALFQTPVSPQDPRTVPLPAAKLARLIATAHHAGPVTQGFENAADLPPKSSPPSPFSAVAPSPFGMAEPASPASPTMGFGTPLPPRREGPPPSLSESPIPEPLPQAASPFALAAPAEVNGASPFTFKPEDPLPAKPNHFNSAPAEPPTPTPPPSPFGMPSASGTAGPATPTPSIFGNGPPASPFVPTTAQASPLLPPAVDLPSVSAPPAAPPPSPFGGFFAGSAATTAAPEPAPHAAPIQPIQPIRPNPGLSIFGPSPGTTLQSTPPAPPSSPPSAAPPVLAPATIPPFPPAHPAPLAPGFGSTFRVSLASLLKGYSAEELGFDPSIVPAFIMTALPAGRMRDQIASGSPSADLGLLVDGITDIGFRNVLSHVKRDFQLRLPLTELTSALAAANGAADLTNLSGGNPQAQSTLRVEPPSAAAALAPADAGPFFAPASQKTEPSREPAVPLFGAAPQPPPDPETRPEPAPAFGLPSLLPIPETKPPSPPQTALPPTAVPAAPSDPFATPLPAAVRPASPPERDAESPPVMAAGSSPFLAPQTAPSAPEAPAQQGGDEVSPSSPWTAPPAAPRSRAASAFPEPKPVLPALFEEAPATTPALPKKPAGNRPNAPASTLGLQPLDTSSEQILLRALLGTDEDLAPQRVVELTGQLPGIAACVCLHGQKTLSHAGAHKPQAREFQRQAADLAHHLRTLGPLIGIEGAETFTLNAGDRLMTFCFPEGAILGVLHDAEPSLGLRDKITLIARELSRMLAD